MDCEYREIDRGRLRCLHCGHTRNAGGSFKRMCPKRTRFKCHTCGGSRSLESMRPRPKAKLCRCGAQLKRRQKLPIKQWWWWCKQCEEFVRECKSCNRKDQAKEALVRADRYFLEDLASEHDAVD